jgi:hypothetical protein
MISTYFLIFTAHAATVDVAVTNVAPMNSVVAQGYLMNISVTVKNNGTDPSTFDVSVRVNQTDVNNVTLAAPIQTVTDLPAGVSTTLTFVWNTAGYAKDNYTVSATADILEDVNPDDNTFTDDVVRVMLPGDATHDGLVDTHDVTAVILGFNAFSGGPRYDPYLDMDASGRVNVIDVVISLINFGKHN